MERRKDILASGNIPKWRRDVGMNITSKRVSQEFTLKGRERRVMNSNEELKCISKVRLGYGGLCTKEAVYNS